MFSFLRAISPALTVRYETLERNLRAGSSSFFDAYLDLLEELLRTEAAAALPEIPSRASAGDLLHDAGFREYLCSVGVDEALCNKLADYVLKINAHKHKREKPLVPEVAVSYLSVLHRIGAALAARRGVIAPVFVGEYFLSIFGSYEREQRALSEDLSDRVDDLADRMDEVAARMERLVAEKPSAPPPTEEERRRAAAQAAESARRVRQEKTVKLLTGAPRSYLYAFGAAERRRYRRHTLITLGVMLALTVAYSILFGVFGARHLSSWRSTQWFPALVRDCFLIYYGLLALRVLRAGDEITERALARIKLMKTGAVGEQITTHCLRPRYLAVSIVATAVLFFFALCGMLEGMSVLATLALCLPLIASLFFINKLVDDLFGGYLLIAYDCRDPETRKPLRVYYDTLRGMYINEPEAVKRYAYAFDRPAPPPAASDTADGDQSPDQH